MGASIVTLATWVYNSEEARLLRAPEASITDDKKALLNSSMGMNDMSIQIPKTPLLQEETALATSRPGSPSHKKRNKDLGYFCKASWLSSKFPGDENLRLDMTNQPLV